MCECTTTVSKVSLDLSTIIGKRVKNQLIGPPWEGTVEKLFVFDSFKKHMERLGAKIFDWFMKYPDCDKYPIVCVLFDHHRRTVTLQEVLAQGGTEDDYAIHPYFLRTGHPLEDLTIIENGDGESSPILEFLERNSREIQQACN